MKRGNPENMRKGRKNAKMNRFLQMISFIFKKNLETSFQKFFKQNKTFVQTKQSFMIGICKNSFWEISKF